MLHWHPWPNGKAILKYKMRNVKTVNGYLLRPTMARIEVATMMVEMVSMVQVFMKEWLVTLVVWVI